MKKAIVQLVTSAITIFFVIVPLTAFAEAPTIPPGCKELPDKERVEITSELSKPVININLPFISFQDKFFQVTKIECTDAAGKVTTLAGKTVLVVPTICGYIEGLYKLAIGVAILIAIIVIMHNGLRWAVSAGSAEAITRAKEGIGNALIGLMLLLGSVMMLNIINPDLIRCRPFEVLKPKLGEGAAVHIDDLDDLELATLDLEDPEARTLTKQTKDKLIAALQEIKTQKIFGETGETKPRITSASRTLEKQLELVAENCFQQRTIGCVRSTCKPYEQRITEIPAPPAGTPYSTPYALNYLKQNVILVDRCPHTQMVGIDIYAPPESIVYQKAIERADANALAIQKKLADIMLKHGFCVLTNTADSSKEEWHFEYPRKSIPACDFTYNPRSGPAHPQPTPPPTPSP